jgi:cell division protein FtsL
MTRSRRHHHNRSIRPSRIGENRYLRIVGVIVVIVVVASFYIYQRVWVRNLVDEIGQLQQRNDQARENLAMVRSEWMAASSIANVETLVGEMKLGLKPTRPSQNFTLSPDREQNLNRYTGLVRAFEKLTNNIPLVSSNEADAGELFEDK